MPQILLEAINSLLQFLYARVATRFRLLDVHVGARFGLGYIEARSISQRVAAFWAGCERTVGFSPPKRRSPGM
jgi:hypothetical protein